MWVAYKDGKKIAEAITYKGALNIVNAHRFSNPNAKYKVVSEGR